MPARNPPALDLLGQEVSQLNVQRDMGGPEERLHASSYNVMTFSLSSEERTLPCLVMRCGRAGVVSRRQETVVDLPTA